MPEDDYFRTFVVALLMNKTMKRLSTLLLIITFAIPAVARQKKVGQISITVDSTLNARSKVTGHMKMKGYDGPIGIKLRGNSSLGFPQKKYTIELRDKEGRDVEASLMGMPAHSDWVLLAPYSDVSTVRDPLAFQLWRDMGHWGPRTQMVELTVNGEYRGIYILSEAIKRGQERVNIAKMKKSDTQGRDVTGGYILRIDTYDEDDATFVSKVPGIGEGNMTSQVIWSCIYPKKKKLQPEQFEYIQNYIDTVEQVIQSDSFADPVKGYARYIDVPSFVDYFIHTELSVNADGYKRSAYFYKEKQKANGKGGKLVAGPVWDYNLAYGNANFSNGDNPEAWCFEGASNSPTPALWQRLLQNPAFRKAVKVRYQTLRKGVLSNESIEAYIDEQARLLAPCLAHHFATFPELLVSEEEKKNLPKARPFGSFPMMGDSIPGGFPMMSGFGGFPMMGDSIPHFPMMGDSIPGGFPMMPGFSRFPMMGDSIPHFPMMGDSIPGGFPMMPGFGGFPMMGDSIPQFPEGFPMMGDFAGFGGFDAVGMFLAYRVSSYEEEIQMLKKWFTDRFTFLDANIERFDQDWQPRIQELKEKSMPNFFEGDFPFPPFGGF